jgi:hypothetical protein
MAAVTECVVANPSVGQLVAMFPSMARNCIEDVYLHCNSDGGKALEALLSMGQDFGHVSPVMCSPRPRVPPSNQVRPQGAGRAAA